MSLVQCPTSSAAALGSSRLTCAHQQQPRGVRNWRCPSPLSTHARTRITAARPRAPKENLLLRYYYSYAYYGGAHSGFTYYGYTYFGLMQFSST